MPRSPSASPRGRPRNSYVWDWFSTVELHGTKQYCCMACHIFSTSTTADAAQLLRHLGPCLAKRVVPPGRAAKASAPGSSGHLTLCTSRTKNVVPITQASFHQDKKTYQQTVRQNIAIYCAACDVPFEVVSNECNEFVTILRSATGLSSSLVPNRHLIAEMIKQEAFHIRQTVTDQLRAADFVHLMIDEWTTKNFKQRFIGVIARARDRSPMVLDVVALADDERATAQVIANHACRICEMYGILEKVSTIVCDGGKNVINTVKLMAQHSGSSGIVQIPCACHRLNLVLQKIACSEEWERTREKMTEMISFIQTSTIHIALLRHLGQKRSIKSYVPNRWQSLIESARSLLDSKPELYHLAGTSAITSERNRFIIDEDFWKKLSEFVVMLSPIQNAIEHLSRDDARAAEVIASVNEVTQKLSGLGGVPDEAFAELRKIVSDQSYEAAEALTVSRVARCSVNMDIAKKIAALLVESNVLKPDFEERKFAEEYLHLCFLSEGNEARQNMCTLLDLARGNTDLSLFWSRDENVQQKFPLIAKAGSRLCSAPASSVPCERLFSGMRRLCCWTRPNLSSETIAATVLVRWKTKGDCEPNIANELCTTSLDTSLYERWDLECE